MGEHDVPVDTVCDELPLFALPTLSTSGATTFRSPCWFRSLGLAAIIRAAVGDTCTMQDRHRNAMRVQSEQLRLGGAYCLRAWLPMGGWKVESLAGIERQPENGVCCHG